MQLFHGRPLVPRRVCGPVCRTHRLLQRRRHKRQHRLSPCGCATRSDCFSAGSEWVLCCVPASERQQWSPYPADSALQERTAICSATLTLGWPRACLRVAALPTEAQIAVSHPLCPARGHPTPPRQLLLTPERCLQLMHCRGEQHVLGPVQQPRLCGDSPAALRLRPLPNFCGQLWVPSKAQLLCHQRCAAPLAERCQRSLGCCRSGSGSGSSQ